ncbi:MAG: ribonucleotide-diphosphate reductase subunit beta [Gemmatirosa sp.]
MPLTAAQTRSPYFALYRNAARLAWDPAAIDLSRDCEDWARIRADHALERYPEQIFQLCALFHQGEESVTRTLAPYLSAVARAGLGVDLELHLAAQLYEEARHFEFFTRYVAEVFAVDSGATATAMPGAPQAVLVDDLQAISDRLRREDDPTRLGDLLTEGVTHYMGVVEAMLARTGYEGAHAALTARGWLPGLREGFRLIRRDEGRHVAFGMHCVRDLVAADPRRAAIVQATFERQLPHVLATVQGFAIYEHPLVDLGALTQFAMRACGQFLAAAGLGDPADAAALEAALAVEA